MEEFSKLILDNIWLALGIGVVIVIVADEVLGLSRGLLGDETETVVREQRAEREEAEAHEDPLDRIEDEAEGARVEDFLKPR